MAISGTHTGQYTGQNPFGHINLHGIHDKYPLALIDFINWFQLHMSAVLTVSNSLKELNIVCPYAGISCTNRGLKENLICTQGITEFSLINVPNREYYYSLIISLRPKASIPGTWLALRNDNLYECDTKWSFYWCLVSTVLWIAVDKTYYISLYWKVDTRQL